MFLPLHVVKDSSSLSPRLAEFHTVKVEVWCVCKWWFSS